MTNGLLKIIASGASVVCINGGSCDTNLPQVSASSSELHAILQIVFGIVGVIAVLIIIIAGFMFVLSDGNPENVSKARETIIYALVGLLVALLAEVIVSFVLAKSP